MKKYTLTIQKKLTY